MKLLTPKESGKMSDERKVQDLSVITYMQTTLDRLQKRINEENTAFDERMKEQREIYGAEKERLQGEIRNLGNEVAEFQKQRAVSMIPVTELIEEAREKNEDAERRLLLIEQGEEELEAKMELVTRKLDELSTREQYISETEQRLSERVKGITEESRQVSEGHERLNKLIAEAEAELTAKASKIAQDARKLEVRERLHQNAVGQFSNDKQVFEKEMKDKREALDRAFAEVNRLKTT